MRVYKFLLAIVIFFFAFVQCQLDEDITSQEFYRFNTEISVEYSTDTISIGDTLWLQSEIGGFLMDSATRKNIHFNSALINQNLMVRAWNVENQDYQPDNVSMEFKTYAAYLTYFDKAIMIGTYYSTVAGKYLIRLGLVFHTPGIYSIDSDYYKFHNYYNNLDTYFGGGAMDFSTLNNETRGAYLNAEMKVENNNLHLYDGLSAIDKSSFQQINETNKTKYFFIKVNE